MSRSVVSPTDECQTPRTKRGVSELLSEADQRIERVRNARAHLHKHGPARLRPGASDGDFERISLSAADGDALRDALIAEGARTVVEVGLAYASSALAIGEALLGHPASRLAHVVIDPFQSSAFGDVGWDAMRSAGLSAQTTLMSEPSSLALPRLLTDGFTADAAFVDGSHRFHEVFVDLYFLRKLVRRGGLIILDDMRWPSVAAAVRYYDLNLGWVPVELPCRLEARRMPEEEVEPAFEDFTPF